MRRITRGTTGEWGTISAPLCYPPVADVVDPVLGASEIPPCPGLDPVGTVYAVGPEQERWVRVGRHDIQWTIVGPNGRVLAGRPANELLLGRGARLLYVPNRTPMARSHIGAPLVRVDGQAALFGQAA